MAQQSPCISIPKKTTEDVDWTTPIRTLISQSYMENPENYATECTTLQRCRQDAVKGAGSEMTGRDLLYKYFGQIELLELRFAEIRVPFPWRDAFTNKLTTQTSLAFEKASIIFQIAATHSSIAASQNRSDPEGLKRAFHFFRTSAGMLTYINDNFLHAPSTDLSREVVKFLTGVVLSQATEAFFEKCVDEKKGNLLISKVAAQTAALYTGLSEEVKEFLGKGIFERNWVTLVQIKTKLFVARMHYYRALADNASGKYGEALARYTIAEAAAKEAHRTASGFSPSFITQLSPTLPADAGTSILEITKTQLALCTEKKSDTQKDNDLIYNHIVPSEAGLPVIEKLAVATAIPIQEVFGASDVQRIIGPDLFIRLVPLSVHESASVYSEEKAKLVRGEVEKAEEAEGSARAALDSLGVKAGLGRYRAMIEAAGMVGAPEAIPSQVRGWQEDIQAVEDRESVADLMREHTRISAAVREQLDNISRDLEIESRDCEALRVKYDHRWTQAPSGSFSKSMRQDLKSHLTALEAAASSDRQVESLWDSVRVDIQLLLSPELEEAYNNAGAGANGSLLDTDLASEQQDSDELSHIRRKVEEIDERLGRLNKISRERNEVLKDLKEKVQNDDVSHILLLNRRNSSVEPTLFAQELEKFRPYQTRLASTVHHQHVAIQEISSLWKKLKESASRGSTAKRWEQREKRKGDVTKRFVKAREGYMEVRDGLAKGLQFYRELSELSDSLRREVKSFITTRNEERQSLVRKLDNDGRDRPPPPPPPRVTGLENSLSSLGLRDGGFSSPSSSSWAKPSSPPPQHPGYGGYQPTPVASYSSPPPPPSAPTLPPPPPPLTGNPYGDMFIHPGLSSQFAPSSKPPTHNFPPSSPPPPPPQNWGAPPQQYPQRSSSAFPPPPPPVSYQSQQQQPQSFTPQPPYHPTSPPPHQGYQTYQNGYR